MTHAVVAVYAASVTGHNPDRPQSRYSRACRKWQAAYEAKRAALTEAESPYSVLDELALIDALMDGLVGRAEDADCPAWRERVLREAEAEGLTGPLMDLLRAGAAADATQAFLRGELERRARLAIDARAMELKASEVVTHKQAVEVFRVWLDEARLALDPQSFAMLAPRLLQRARAAGIGDG